MLGDLIFYQGATAKNAGIVSVWKYRENRENPDNVKPDYSIVNLEELETIVLDKE